MIFSKRKRKFSTRVFVNNSDNLLPVSDDYFFSFVLFVFSATILYNIQYHPPTYPPNRQVSWQESVLMEVR